MMLRNFALGIAAVVACATAALANEAPKCPGRNFSQDASIKPNYASFADDLDNADGLLWKIDRDGLAPSYLYGTMHSTQAKPIMLAREALQYLQGATAVATELGGPMDSATKINMNAAMLSAALSPDADTFAGLVTGGDADIVEKFLAKHGYPQMIAHHMKLWFLALAVGLPDCEIQGKTLNLPEVDEAIAEAGAARGIPVIGLETIDEQVRAVSTMPPELAAQMLTASARFPDFEDDAYVTLLDLYAQKRPAYALPILDAVPEIPRQSKDAEREFTKLLVIERNETMANRAAPLLEKGGAFIAVGALHLSGKQGLVERFRAKGYKVSRVW